jgi:hypothetical protein
MCTRYLTGLLVMLTMATPAWADDTPFTPDAAATWSARAMRMANVAGDGDLSRASFGTACDGLTGEQMHHEYGKEPRWALGAQLEICAGYDGWAGKFGASKGPCSLMKKGLEQLANATLENSPQEVVAAAAALRQTVTTLLAATEGHKGACHLR